jgi:hypothetical protein
MSVTTRMESQSSLEANEPGNGFHARRVAVGETAPRATSSKEFCPP